MHPLTRVKVFVSDLLSWSGFVGGLAASSASGAVLDGTGKDIATYGGIGVSLLTGSRIAKKPSGRPTSPGPDRPHDRRPGPGEEPRSHCSVLMAQ